MKKILINVILVFITLTVQSQIKKIELENRNGTYYKIGEEIPFTGESYTFYSENKKETYTEFIDGELNGVMKKWFLNGKIEVSGKMVKGKKNGNWIAWFSNGNKLREGKYKDNKEEGIFTWWYENGKLKKRGNYKNGSSNGKWTWYFNNGQKESEGKLLSEINIGKWFWWNEKGELIHEKDFSEKLKNRAFNQLIIGKWNYIKSTDKENKPIEHIIRKYPNGKEMKIVASGPNIIINKDGTYEKKFTKENTDYGNWEMLTEDEIKFEMVIPKNSEQAKFIAIAQKAMGKKWKEDEKGNYLDSSTDKIISLTETIMKIEYEKDYVLIYKKESE